MSRGSKRRERSHPRALPILISAVLFLSGCGMLLYPTLSNWLSNRHQSELYVAYQDQVDELDDGDAEAELERARKLQRPAGRSGEAGLRSLPGWKCGYQRV